MTELSHQLDAARRAVRAASEVCLAAADPVVMSKRGAEPVTVADFASQAVILRELEAARPDDAIVAEESGATLGDLGGVKSLAVAAALAGAPDAETLLGWIDHRGGADDGTYWAVDPIDGTKGFLRGEQFAVAVGLVVDGKPVAGVLGLPRFRDDGARGVVVWGAAGVGAFVEDLRGGDPEPVAVSDRADPRSVRVLGSVEAAHGDPVMVSAVIGALGIEGGWVRMDSQAKYGAIALGEAEVYVRPRNRPDFRERVWDHAAGAAIVTAAGGRVTDLDGRELDFSLGPRLEENRGVLATNGPVHDDVLEVLARIDGAHD